MHCADETGWEGGESGLLPNDPVIISTNNPTYQKFLTSGTDVNGYLSVWRVLEVIEDAGSGYLGIIYLNITSRQLVLAHRSTNFRLSLFSRNLVRQSGVHQDIEGVLIGGIYLHQAWGYAATKLAVDYVTKSTSDYFNFALSFTGHSLGAWLAALSLLYCHDDFKFEFAQAITFDGPGSREMMEKLRTGDIVSQESPTSRIALEDLDIITYLSAPHLVNCVNQQVGTVYRLYSVFPGVSEEISSSLSRKIGTAILENFPGSILALIGHDLQYMLPYFSPTTGKPREQDYTPLAKLPSIYFKGFGTQRDWTVSHHVVKIIRGMLPSFFGTPLGLASKIGILNWESTTVDSVIHLAVLFFENKIDSHQFWILHDYLDPDSGYRVSSSEASSSLTDQFLLTYKAGYREVDSNTFRARKTGTTTDNCLKILARARTQIQGQQLRDLKDQYTYDAVNNIFVINDKFRNSVAVEDVRSNLKSIRRSNPDLDHYLNKIDEPRLLNNLGVFDLVENWESVQPLLNYKTGIVKGMSGTGKTSLVKTFGKALSGEFITRIVNCKSEYKLQSALQTCIKSLNIDDPLDMLMELRKHLDSTKQRVLFILDDVQSLQIIAEFLKTFNELSNVRIIITTRNDRLFNCNHIPQVRTEFLPVGKARLQLRNHILSTVKGMSTRLSKAVSGSIPNILKVMTFLNSITKEVLISRLSLKENAKHDLRSAFTELQQVSFLTLNGDGTVQTNSVVQEVAINFYSTMSDCLQMMSIFKPSDFISEYIVDRMTTFDLETESVELHRLKSGLPEIYLCNFGNVLNWLREQKLTPKQLGFIDELRKYFIEASEEILQSMLSKLLNGWTYAQESDSIESFLVKEGVALEIFIEAFGTFSSTFQQEFNSVSSLTGQHSTTQHVLVIGPTGGGKKTIIDHLIGNELACVKVGRNGEATEIIVGKLRGYNAGKIGNNPLISETNTITPYFCPSRNSVFWDFPGFFDSRGEICKIQHAFLMNSFTAAVKHFKILLVVDASILHTTKGEGFVSLLNTLSTLFSKGKICNNMSLLITKCAPINNPDQKKSDKMGFINHFEKLTKEHPDSWLLKIFSHQDMYRKLSLFPSVIRTGVLDPKSSFFDLESSIEACSCVNMEFEVAIDSPTNVQVTSLTNLLNRFALHLTSRAALKRNSELRELVHKEDFRKEDLSQIEKFCISPIETEFVKEFRAALNDEPCVEVLNGIIKTINLFCEMKLSVSPNLSSWVEPFREFDELLTKLFSKPVLDISQDESGQEVMDAKATILSASEIQKLYLHNKSIKEIRCSSNLFIVEQDIYLPGVNLYVASGIWAVIGSREINLKGGLGSINSGNFFGSARVTRGGKISFELSGANGEDGVFNRSHVDEKISEWKKKLCQLQKKLNSIKELLSSGGI